MLQTLPVHFKTKTKNVVDNSVVDNFFKRLYSKVTGLKNKVPRQGS